MGYTSTGAEKSTWCAARTPTPAMREAYPNWLSGNGRRRFGAAWVGCGALSDDQVQHRGSVRGVLVSQVNGFRLGLAAPLGLS
jgi:hypothetical protein